MPIFSDTVAADAGSPGSDKTDVYDPSDPPPDGASTPQWYPPGISLHQWNFSGGLDADSGGSGDLTFTGPTEPTTDPISLYEALSMIQGSVTDDDKNLLSFPDDFTPPVDPGGDFDAGPFTIHVITSAGAVIRLDDNTTHGQWFIGRADNYLGENDPPPTPGTYTPSGNSPPGKPYVSIGATVGTGDDSNKATFTVSRYGDTSEDLTVQLFPAAGSAVDQDVQGMPSSITISAGDSSASFVVTVDSSVAGPLTVVATLKADSTYWLSSALAAGPTVIPRTVPAKTKALDTLDKEDQKHNDKLYYTPSGINGLFPLLKWGLNQVGAAYWTPTGVATAKYHDILNLGNSKGSGVFNHIWLHNWLGLNEAVENRAMTRDATRVFA